MTTTVITGVVQLSTGSAANWTSTTKVIPASVLLYETDTGKAKVTDGVNLYSALSYFIGNIAKNDVGNGLQVASNKVAVQAADSSINVASGGISVNVGAGSTVSPRFRNFSGGVLAAPSSSQELMFSTVERAVTFPSNFANSVANCKIAPTSTYVLTVNSYAAGGNTPTQIGTITFNAGSRSGVFSTTGATAISLSAGQTIEVVAPSVTDSTFSICGFTLTASF